MLYLVVWLIFDGKWPEALGPRTWGSIAYLGVFGSVFGFMLFFYALRHLPASVMGLITLIAPVLALWLGWLVANERPTPLALLGTAMVLGGLVMAQFRGFRLRRMVSWPWTLKR